MNFDLPMTVENGTHILVVGTVQARIEDIFTRLLHYGGNICKYILQTVEG